MNSLKSKSRKSKVLALGALVGLLLLVPVSATAQLISLFDVGMGVRPAGMGEAFTGLADDENALFYNPAALALLEKFSGNTLYESHFGASDYLTAALGGPSFGAGLLFFNFRSMARRDAQDQEVGTFGYSNFALIGAFGMRGLAGLRALENLALGLKLKFYRANTLAEGSGSGLALDPSFMLTLGDIGLAKDLRVGAMIENILSLGVRYGSGHVERWGFGLRLGVSATLLERFKAAADLSPGGLHLGGEVPISTGFGQLLLRAGVLTRGGLSLSMGFGVKFGNFRVDYAYIAHPRLPDSQRLSIAFEF